MPQLILNIDATQEQVLQLLEQIDGQTADQRFAKYIADIVQNEARVDTSRPERIASRLAELAEDAEQKSAEAVSTPEA